MEIPANTETCELSDSIIWLKEGIVYSTPKSGITETPNRQNIREKMEKIRAFVGEKKICLVVEINPKSKPASKENRDFVATEIASVTKAMAMITVSPLTKMLVNLFFGFKPPSYPMKMFTSELEATNWIRRYL